MRGRGGGGGRLVDVLYVSDKYIKGIMELDYYYIHTTTSTHHLRLRDLLSSPPTRHLHLTSQPRPRIIIRILRPRRQRGDIPLPRRFLFLFVAKVEEEEEGEDGEAEALVDYKYGTESVE